MKMNCRKDVANLNCMNIPARSVQYLYILCGQQQKDCIGFRETHIHIQKTILVVWWSIFALSNNKNEKYFVYLFILILTLRFSARYRIFHFSTARCVLLCVFLCTVACVRWFSASLRPYKIPLKSKSQIQLILWFVFIKKWAKRDRDTFYW